MIGYIDGMKSSSQGTSGRLLPLPVLERVAPVLRVLAHARRLRIVDILERSGSLPVFEIARQVDLPQPAASHHLNAMKRVGLLAARRHGQEVRYSIADPRALTILSCLRKKGAADA